MSRASADPGGLGRRSITAMLWGTGGSLVRVILQVVSQIVLARLLGPELYGVFALALVLVLLSTLFADGGLAHGLIQKRSVSASDLRFIFTWQVMLGLIVMAIMWAAAPAIAKLYGDPRVAPVVALLAPSCLINAAAATSGAILRREMDFRALNIAMVASYALGYFGVAIPMALGGAGVTALVGGFVVQSAAQGAIQYAFVRHPLRPLLWSPDAPPMLSFGLTVLATNLTNWAVAGIDRAISGMAFGVSAAGLYATAYNLISTPALAILSLVQSVFYSASAKVQDDKDQLGRGLRTLCSVILLFVAPLFVGAAAAAETIIVTLYGARWSGGGDVLAPLALAMPAQLLMGLATPVLWASGATRREFQLQIPIAVCWVIVLWLVAQIGSLALLGWAVCILFYLRAGVIVLATLKAIDMAFPRFARACVAGLVLNAIVGAVCILVDRSVAPLSGRGLPLLAADMIASAAGLLIGLRLLGRWVDDGVLRLLGQFVERLPIGQGQPLVRILLGR